MSFRVMLLLLCLVLFSACNAQQASRHLPNDYKVWVMNAREVYLADRNNELVIGPALRKIGVTKHHIVTFSEPSNPEYTGNLRTTGYSVLDVSTGKVSTGLSEQDVQVLLTNKGEIFPEMVDFDAYPLVSR